MSVLSEWCDSQPNRYKYRIIVALILGRPLKSFGKGHKDNEVVHHINGDHNDNRNCNLLVSVASYHTFIHNI